jgi:hypothetical protein
MPAQQGFQREESVCLQKRSGVYFCPLEIVPGQERFDLRSIAALFVKPVNAAASSS